MGDYASKAVGTAGLTTGIIGTGLGLMAMHGDGFGLFGGGNKTSELQAKISELTAEKYANNVGIEVYKAAAERDAKQNAIVADLAKEIADIRVREAALHGEINTNNAAIQGQIASVAAAATNGINVLTANLACLQNTVSGITKTIVPITAVCPEPMKAYNSWTAPTN